MAHLTAIEDSARTYIHFLNQRLASLPAMPPPVAALARATLETTTAALVDRANLKPQDVKLNLAVVNAALCGDSKQTLGLLNEATPGLGSPDPRVVFVGKEAAYDASRPTNFLLESLALTLLWLSYGSPNVLGALLGMPCGLDFLGNPASFYQQYQTIASGHTWRKIGYVVANSQTCSPGGSASGPSAWCGAAYLVELSATPAFRSGGLAPGAVRGAFLETLARNLPSARTMVFHSQRPNHAAAQECMIAAFLGVNAPDLPRIRSVPLQGRTQGSSIEQWDWKKRRAIRCRHLSNSVSNGYLGALAGMIL